MISSLLTQAQEFAFITKGGSRLDLYGALTMWTDSIRIRLASHEYLKRDGGEVEPMGAAQGRWTFKCCFIGFDVTQRWQTVVATIRREPRGKIIHPRLGQINVGCEGANASEDPERAINAIDFEISFVEDAVDTATARDAEIGPLVRARRVQAYATLAVEAVSKITSAHLANSIYAAVVATMADLANSANNFQALAVAASQSPSPDLTLSLETQLDRLQQKRDAVLADLVKTRAVTLDTDTSLTDARTSIYVTFASALQLYAAVVAQKPPIIHFVVPTTMPLTAVAVRVYGKDARAKMDEIYSLNRLTTPFWIPRGTVLRLVAPSVRQ